MQEISIGLAGGRRDRERGTVHWKGYGQGSVGTRIGVRCSACGEDATEGGGCGDDSFSDAGGIVEWADSTRCGAGRSGGGEGGADAADGGYNEASCGEAGEVGVDAGGSVFKRGVAAGDGIVLRADCDVSGAGGVEGTSGVASSAGVACGGEVLGAGHRVCGVCLFWCE